MSLCTASKGDVKCRLKAGHYRRKHAGHDAYGGFVKWDWVGDEVPTTLAEIARWTNVIASDNGFDSPTWDNMLAKLALAVLELNEARDGVIGKGDDPLEEELADTAIRLLSILDNVWPDDSSCDRITNRKAPSRWHPYQAIETLLWVPLAHICGAMETWRHDNQADTRMHIEFALLELWRLADMLNIDLTAEVIAKCEKNQKRPRLHGKKQSVG